MDGDSLRSVLVLEAWALADQAHMKQTLFPHAGQVVKLTNFKLQSKGRSLGYFDRDLKVAFDKNSKVDLGTGECPCCLMSKMQPFAMVLAWCQCKLRYFKIL